jgi:hypothetical protein
VWFGLEQGLDPVSIADQMAAEADTPSETVQRDVAELVTQFEELGFRPHAEDAL